MGKYNSNNIKKSKMSLVYVYGSGECEQLGLGDDAPAEIKRPRKPAIFDVPP